MKRKWITAFFIYVALLVLCIAVIYIVPSVKGLLEKTYIAEYGTISIDDEVSGYILRDEVVYTAEEDCKVERVAEHNQLTKAGSRIVKITPDEDADDPDEEQKKVHRKYRDVLEELADHTKATANGKSKDAGYISYFIDGAEAQLSLNRLMDLDEDNLKDLTSKKEIETPDGNVIKGEPIFKVTKNSKWYYVFYLDNKEAERYYEGRTVSLRTGDTDATVTVVGNEPGKKKTKITLSCKLFFEGFLEERRMDALVTVASAQGLVLKDSSLIEKDGKTGVLVKNKLGEHVFTPVSILADNGEECVAYGDIYVDEEGNFVETIGTYDEIVESPTDDDIEDLDDNK